MSQNNENNNDDLELDGFDFGDGSDEGIVLEDEFGDFEPETQSEPEPEPEPQPQPERQPRQQRPQQDQQRQQRPQQQGQQQQQRQPQQRQQQEQQRPPQQGQQPRRNYPQAEGYQDSPNQQVVTTMSGRDKNRMRSQQRVNPQRPNNNNQLQQNRQIPRQMRQGTYEQMYDEGVPMLEDNQPPKKKKSKVKLVLIPLLLIVAIVVGVAVVNANKLVPQEEVYEQTGRYAYDNLVNALNNYDATKVDTVAGKEVGDSYLAQEWSYANCNEIRESFIKSVCANVKFTYPQVNQMSTTGKQMKNKDGSPILVESSMNNGEAVTVTHVDYANLAETMKEDKDNILALYDESGIGKKDYDYEDEMTDLMLDYIVSRGSLPTKTTDITLGVSTGASPLITDDTELDKLLFSSEEFHNMCDVFAQVATGFTGFKTEKYTEKEEQTNPEYKQWKMRFDAYYKADHGKFHKGVSKWEPWYLRDGNNNFILDEKGKKIVNYYSIKDDQGNDWIQPDKKILVDVEKERQIEVEWKKDSVIPYCFMGAYYCQNEYDGSFSPEVRVGDGSIEHPAGVGTPIITKCLGTDGKYHDVKVTMVGYWEGQDAIDYAVSFSEKNRGFDINSVVQLICYEMKIENLENKAFTFKSDMFLSDRSANKSTRTGTMYGFYSEATVKGGESVIINDWATSTELQQKYASWGSSFNREYKVVYFKVLAGDGDVPTYSAYKAFTGESRVNNGEEMPEESAEPTTPAQQGTDTTQQSTDTTQQGTNTDQQSTDTTQQQGTDTTQQQGTDTTQQQ